MLVGIAGFIPGITTNFAGGFIYLALWLYGLFNDLDSSANFVPVNTADNWLHFGLGVLMVGLGAVLGNRRSVPSAS